MTEINSQAQASVVSLTQGLGGIVGIKAGMTQVYSPTGDAMAVTVIKIPEVIITEIKTVADHGYVAVQVGVAEKKLAKSNRAIQGHVKKAGERSFYQFQELRLPLGADLSGLSVGQQLGLDFLAPGDLVDLCGVSKGKGFQGVMKRYNYAGGPASHGASLSHRSIGSIGNRADPGKVFKGKKMPGQMGNKRVTVQNVEVVSIDSENRVLLVNGSVPGARSGLVTVRRAVKKSQGKG